MKGIILHKIVSILLWIMAEWINTKTAVILPPLEVYILTRLLEDGELIGIAWLFWCILLLGVPCGIPSFLPVIYNRYNFIYGNPNNLVLIPSLLFIPQLATCLINHEVQNLCKWLSICRSPSSVISILMGNWLEHLPQPIVFRWYDSKLNMLTS